MVLLFFLLSNFCNEQEIVGGDTILIPTDFGNTYSRK